MIRQLPAGFALVIRGGCAPVIARLPRAWKNPAYRRARRLGCRGRDRRVSARDHAHDRSAVGLPVPLLSGDEIRQKLDRRVADGGTDGGTGLPGFTQGAAQPVFIS